MTLFERLSESLARTLVLNGNRRDLGAALFGLAAAAAVKGPGADALTKAKCRSFSVYKECNAPFSLYCSAFGKSLCDGGSCAGNCHLNTDYYPSGGAQVGCWCTAMQGGGANRFYYKCCDCLCPGSKVPVNTVTRGDETFEVQSCGCREQIWITKKGKKISEPYKVA